MRTLFNSTFYLALTGLAVALVTDSVAQEPAPPLADRVLTGSVDIGDVGRYVGLPQLGTLTVTGDDVAADGAHPIQLNANGFAWLPNGILLRNGSATDLAWDGPSQSHDLEVYYFGDFGSTNGIFAGQDLGQFDIPSLNATNTDVVTLTDEVRRTSFGGYWDQFGQYERTDGVRTTRFLTSSDGVSPSTLTQGRFLENNRDYNRTDSAPPEPLDEEIRPLLDPPSFLIPEESRRTSRVNPLLSVDVADPSAPAATLDLSGLDVAVAGTRISDRQLSGQINLGRFIAGSSPVVVDQPETLTVRTSGTDDQRTRLSLAAFDEQVPGLQVVSSQATTFDSAASTAEVSLTPDFTIETEALGQFTKTVDVGNKISSSENLLGQTNQSSLNIGYRYGVVENNGLVADDVTVYAIDGFDTTDVRVPRLGSVGAFDSNSALLRREFSTSTHTNIRLDRDFDIELDGMPLQEVTLNAENGIIGEGLDGETVSAEATFDIHTVSILPSELSLTQTDNVVEIENVQVSIDNKPLAAAYLRGAQRSGSDRWYLDGATRSIEAGQPATIAAIFDDAELPDSELGRDYRTEFTLSFEDGIETFQLPVPDTRAANGQRLSGPDFVFDTNVLGSEDTQQDLSWIVERSVSVSETSGSLELAVGTSLRDEGLNLTNTTTNTSQDLDTPTEFRVLDADVLTAETRVTVNFVSLDDAATNELYENSDTSLLISDIVELGGLNGTLHVVELSFNADDDLGGEVLWLDTNGLWVNAVLGNSDVEPGAEPDPDSPDGGVIFVDGEPVLISDYLNERRFNGDYNTYLASLDEGEGPALGAFGSDDQRAWAVIDHNSSFAVTTAIPEPSSLWILGVGALAAATRRRR